MPTIYKSEIVRGWAHDVSIGYRNHAYIARHPYPIVVLDSPKTKVWKHNKGDAFRSQAVLRGPGARSQLRHRKGTSVNVDTNQYGIGEQITDEDLAARRLPAGATPPLDLTGEATMSNADQHDLRLEIAVATSINAQTWSGGNVDAEGLWEPLGSTNTFIADLLLGIGTMVSAGADRMSLGLLVDQKTFTPLSHSDDLVDRIKHTGRDSITTALLANLFMLKEVVVGSALKNTADEKADGTDGTYVQVWEANANKGMAFLYVVPPRIGKNMISAGMTAKNKMLGNAGRISEQWYEKPNHAWTVETREDNGLVVTDLGSGYLWTDTFAS